MVIETSCERCGKPCQGGDGNPDAKLLKRSHSGYCADCALTLFLKSNFSYVLGDKPEMLRLPQVRQQIANLLITGNSDAGIGEIDIEHVIGNWDIPWK